MTTEDGSTSSRLRVASLLDALPQLGSAVPQEDMLLARRVLVVPVTDVLAGQVLEARVPREAHALAYVVVKGLVFKSTPVGKRTSLEVLGPGDVLIDLFSPPQPDLAPCDHVAHLATSVIVLDDRFRTAARRWPKLHEVLIAMVKSQAQRTATRLAIMSMSRVEDRIAQLFVHLGARFGQVTMDGVILTLPFTHDVIGQLVGSKRPTVSLALTELTEEGCLRRDDSGRWLLTGRCAPSLVLPD